MEEMPPARPLSADELALVQKELVGQARGRILAGVACCLIALGGVLLMAAQIARLDGSNLIVLGLMIAVFGSMGLIILLGRRRKGVPWPQDFEAVRLLGHCETRITGSGKNRTVRHYVGGYRVNLREGWLEFWPNGQTVEVELCFAPRRIHSIWADAALVSLPGINVEQAARLRPPSAPVALTFVTVFAILGSVCCFVWAGEGNYWSELGKRFGQGDELRLTSVRELSATPTAWGKPVSLAKAQFVGRSEGLWHLCDFSAQALAALPTAGDIDREEQPSEQLERARRVRVEVFENPANVCVYAQEPTKPERFINDVIYPVKNETGELRALAGGHRQWYPATAKVSLTRVSVVVLSVLLALGLLLRAVPAIRNYKPRLAAWKQAVLADSKQRASSDQT